MYVGGSNIPSFEELEFKLSSAHEDEFHYLVDLYREPEESQEGPERGA